MLSTVSRSLRRTVGTRSMCSAAPVASKSTAPREINAPSATMSQVFDNHELENMGVQYKPHTIMYCPRNPMTFDTESQDPKDYVLAKVPKTEDSLEWVLSSPCPIHQFDEPPIIVEIEHLQNLFFEED